MAPGTGVQPTRMLPAVTWLPCVGALSVGATAELPRTVMMGAGWVINVLVAEWVIRRSARRAIGTPRGHRQAVEGQPTRGRRRSLRLQSPECSTGSSGDYGRPIEQVVKIGSTGAMVVITVYEP